MASVLIVSGCPGAGKTTLAKRLAAKSVDGLHIESDLFREVRDSRNRHHAPVGRDDRE